MFDPVMLLALLGGMAIMAAGCGVFKWRHNPQLKAREDRVMRMIDLSEELARTQATMEDMIDREVSLMPKRSAKRIRKYVKVTYGED